MLMMPTGKMVPYLFITTVVFFLAGCGESDAERQAREKREGEARDAAVDACIDRAMKACEVDPKFTYCGIKFGNDTIGSGCTRTIDNLPFDRRGDFCKEEVKSTVRRDCLIAQYGCTAITGDINCK